MPILRATIERHVDEIPRLCSDCPFYEERICLLPDTDGMTMLRLDRLWECPIKNVDMRDMFPPKKKGEVNG